MPRCSRISPDGYVQHIVNRGDHRETLFHKPGDFDAFLRALTETAGIIRMRILAYCVMRNHFHLVLWPYAGPELPVFMHRLMNVHIRRYLRHYPPVSPGHLYQGRYTNAIVESGRSVLNVIRYVEANALTARIVKRAEHYPWSSAWPHWDTTGRPELAEWSITKPIDWLTLLNLRTPAAELKRIQQCASRGAPYGGADWTARVVKQFKLEHTIRPVGRPKRDDRLAIADDQSPPL